MTTPRPYNKEQMDAYLLVWGHLQERSLTEKKRLLQKIEPYLIFRKETATFFEKNVGEFCRKKCYENRVSACCSREGIITFFADVVINVLVSPDKEIRRLMDTLLSDRQGDRCVYLGEKGCVWQIKPIVCEMFLCDSVKKEVFEKDPQARQVWEQFQIQEKSFKWPDRPILFDDLEAFFMEKSLTSPLMYFHNSPGLLRVKRNSASSFRQK